MSNLPAESRGAAATNVRWVVLAIVSFASASAYLTRYCISAANTTIQADLGFGDVQMGQLMSAFALGYLLCQLPGGWLGNRLGTRLALALLSLFWSLSNAWSAMASAFGMLWASRLSLGLFQAGLTPISAKILNDWMPLRARGVSSAWIAASMSIGGAFTMWLTGWLLGRDYGWRGILSAYSLVGLVWSIGFFWYFRSFPREHHGVNQAELDLITPHDPSLGQPAAAETQPAAAEVMIANGRSAHEVAGGRLLRSMLISPGMWGLCVQSFFRSAGYAFFVTWFFAFLEYGYGIGKAEAGLLNSLPLIAVVMGCISGGLIVDWLLRITDSKWISRTGTAIAALVASGCFTMASAWTSSASQLAIVIAVGALFYGIGAPAAWAATIDIGGRQTAVVMATMNMAGCLATVILPVVLGSWFNAIRETGGDWNRVIYLHAGFCFVAAVSWFVVQPNRELA